jgi:octopine/nopaline transport system substrate-binding protein
MKLFRPLALALLGAALATGASAQKKWETVKIATEGAYAPWNFSTPQGKLDGFEPELAMELCRRMNVKCEVVAQDWDGIIPALQAGKYDAIMAGMNITPKREEVIQFSRVYAAGPHGWGAMKDSPLAKLEGEGQILHLEKDAEAAKKMIESWKPVLKGKTIGVQGSTTNSAFLEKYLKGTIEIREYKTTEQHDLDLVAGRVDLVMASVAYLSGALTKPGNEGMTMTGPRFQGGMLGRGSSIGLRKEDTALKAMFDKAIREAQAEGVIKRLSEKYFGFDVTPL